MSIDKENTRKPDRRRASRIYEQVNLFYHKTESSVDPIELDLSPSLDDSPQSLVEASIPVSHSQENDSLNVNISASGISFTCKDELKPGDYLMIRILLLSSITTITTACKVVYFKPSNPYETEQYPYKVGAHFVNLKQEEKTLLDTHISKKKTRRYIANGLLLSLFMTLIMIPDLIVEVLTELTAFLLDNFIEFAHVLYELIEYSLDHLIEHIFHTSMQETQIIVFYIQIVIGIAGLYAVIRYVPPILKNVYLRCRLFLHRKKSSVFYCWGEQSIWYKLGFILTGIFILFCYLLFFI